MRYPGGEFRQLGSDVTHQPLMSKHDGVVLHTMVGSLAGTDAYFKSQGYVGVESHFGVGSDGTVWQWVDTDRTADANLYGSPHFLSIETADTGVGFNPWSGSDVPAWTPAQVDAIAKLVAWMCKTHDFPASVIPDSKPGRRGIGWHRMGVDSSPLYQPGYRVSGGEHWSTSLGKVCLPTDSTDVLTERGWVALPDVTSDDQVASWSMDSETVTFAPAARIEAFEADVFDVGGFESTGDHQWVRRDPDADVRCSCGYTGARRGVRTHAGHGTRRGEDHRVLRTAGWKKVAALELNDRDVLPSAVEADLPGLPLTPDELRLLVWAQADGHYMTDSRAGNGAPFGVEWHFSKERKISRLSALLDRLALPYSRSARHDGTTTIRVYGDAARKSVIQRLPSKRFTADMIGMSRPQADAFLDELIHADGSTELGCYFTTDAECADIVQAIATLNGRTTSHRVDATGLHWVRFLKRARRARHATVTRSTEVACLTTVDGTLIIRQHGRVVVTGNCPGDRRIAQVESAIIPKVRAIIGGTIEPPPPPHDPPPARPLADAALRAKGDCIRAEKAYIADHPNMPALDAMLAKDQEDWQTWHSLATP